MPREGSVAPKERINITYKNDTGGVDRDVELPLKVLMVGDYTKRADERPLEERVPLNINKQNFDEVLADQNIQLTMNVPNRLSGEEGDELPVTVGIDSMKAFRPESVAEQVPELQELLALRKALVALKGPLGNVPSFRKALEEVIKDESKRLSVMQELDL